MVTTGRLSIRIIPRPALEIAQSRSTQVCVTLRIRVLSISETRHAAPAGDGRGGARIVWGWAMFTKLNSIKAKLLILQGLFLATILVAGIWSATSKRETMVEGYRKSIEAVVQTSLSIMKSYDARAAKGEFSREEAQTRAKAALRAQRVFGNE